MKAKNKPIMTLQPFCASCILKVFSTETEYSLGISEKAARRTAELAKYLARNFSLDVSQYGKWAWELDAMAKNGARDPYKKLKDMENKKAGALAAKLSPRNLEEALLFALAGNSLDFGHISPEKAFGVLAHDLKAKPVIDDRKRAAELINKHAHITYIIDNCGEIYFDKLLIEMLVRMGKKLTIVVRSRPFINDATLEDIKKAGIASLADKIVEFNGIGYMKTKGLVLAKGQAAFITMANYQAPAIYLLKVKCRCIARNLQVPEMSTVAMVVE